VDSDELVKSLNLLLDTLEIPIELESLLDLTPTLLLLILESSLKSRLPLPARLREDRSRESGSKAIAHYILMILVFTQRNPRSKLSRCFSEYLGTIFCGRISQLSIPAK
jgi:hypothetical protein